jgi:hypothetical protein
MLSAGTATEGCEARGGGRVMRSVRARRSCSNDPLYGADTAVFNHGESISPVEAPAAGCCVPATRATGL